MRQSLYETRLSRNAAICPSRPGLKVHTTTPGSKSLSNSLTDCIWRLSSVTSALRLGQEDGNRYKP